MVGSLLPEGRFGSASCVEGVDGVDDPLFEVEAFEPEVLFELPLVVVPAFAVESTRLAESTIALALSGVVTTAVSFFSDESGMLTCDEVSPETFVVSPLGASVFFEQAARLNAVRHPTMNNIFIFMVIGFEINERNRRHQRRAF